MKSKKPVKFYSPLEEKINVLSHLFGFILSFISLIFIVKKSVLNGSGLQISSSIIFGLSLMILFAASTFYHSSKTPELRSRLRILDHSAIYILIAGTYTPYALVTLNGPIGWTVFFIAWGLALIGITLKLFFTGKYNLASTLMYLFMGWIIVFVLKPLINNLPSDGIFWLVSGGISYTVGAILYSIKKIKFNHAIFHILVLIGSFCHFISIFFYVL